MSNNHKFFLSPSFLYTKQTNACVFHSFYSEFDSTYLNYICFILLFLLCFWIYSTKKKLIFKYDLWWFCPFISGRFFTSQVFMAFFLSCVTNLQTKKNVFAKLLFRLFEIFFFLQMRWIVWNRRKHSKSTSSHHLLFVTSCLVRNSFNVFNYSCNELEYWP